MKSGQAARTAVWMVMSTVVCCVAASTTVVAFDRSAGTAGLDRAARTRPSDVSIDPTTRRIAVVGDSIVFSRLGTDARVTAIVPLAQTPLEGRVPGISVNNLSVPGLSTLHTIDPRATTLRPYLTRVLDAPGPRPDVVVVAVSSIDINLFPDVRVALLAPALLDELRAVERMLAMRGVDAVFLPAFRINDGLYNELRARSSPFRDYGFGRRVDEFNSILRASGLPLLFDRFAGLDRNDDGNADRGFFVGYDQRGEWPDDGIHPNALGERVFADNLADGLVTAFERG